MNLDAATATLRALALVAGVPNADSVTITVTPYKEMVKKPPLDNAATTAPAQEQTPIVSAGNAVPQ